jgi:hypothetical protein
MSMNDILASINEEIARLGQARQLLAGASATKINSSTPSKPVRKRRRLSAAARKRIADAQRQRWAKQKKAAQRPDATANKKS